MKKILIIVTLAFFSNSYSVSNAKLEDISINSKDFSALRDGAKLFMDYCSGCHSLKYMRLNRMSKDLSISDEELNANYNPANKKHTDFITSSITGENSVTWFGKQPPDLSLVGRSRGKDWLYAYLISFHVDDKKPSGSNNLVFPDVSMPNILEGLQGQQSLQDGHLSLIPNTGSLSPTEFKAKINNLVNFLVYVSEPIKNYRSYLGYYVIAFLLFLLILAYLLKKEFWKDIH